MDCRKCNEEINPLRVKALPNTKVCVNCSDTEAYYGRNVISGKTTYSELEIIKDQEVAKEMEYYDKRAGWGSSLHKVRR